MRYLKPWWLAFIIGFGLMAAINPARSQAIQTRVTADCSSISWTWAADDLGRQVAVDTKGRLCITPPTSATPTTNDPCNYSPKQSVAINITSAATTSLVAPSGTTTIYVCAFTVTISQVVTTANTITFVTGTGATCGTGTVSKTGLFGAGGVTAAPPIVVIMGDGMATLFKSAASDRLCATTAIGASGSFQGVLTYVQI